MLGVGRMCRRGNGDVESYSLTRMIGEMWTGSVLIPLVRLSYCVGQEGVLQRLGSLLAYLV